MSGYSQINALQQMPGFVVLHNDVGSQVLD